MDLTRQTPEDILKKAYKLQEVLKVNAMPRIPLVYTEINITVNVGVVKGEL